MSNAIRTLAVSALLASFLPATHAGLVQVIKPSELTFDFSNSSIWGAFEDKEVSQIFNESTGSAIAGVSLKNATLFKGNPLDPTEPLALGLSLTATGRLVIDFTGSSFTLNALKVDYFAGSQREVFINNETSPSILLETTGGKFSTDVALKRQGCDPATSATDCSQLVDSGYIQHIEFDLTDADGLTGLSFSLIPTNGGGTVPEPASYGLAALALLAAGTASRRRRAG